MLYLNMNHVTDASLKNLSLFPKLNYLQLFEPDITDESAESILKLTKLTTLNLYWSGFTDKGIAKLQAAMPKCHIQFNPSGSGDYARQAREKI